jgi:Lon protease-like protein
MANENHPPKSLPEILPVFPLTGVLLLPGMPLPLHVFEPRYRNLVEDALKEEGVFGMIQPIVPRQDNRPPPGADQENPDLYKIGCAGYIEKWERSPDGRFMIELKGLNRFRAEEELAIYRGYRRVKANYEEFLDSATVQEWKCDRAGLIQALQAYARNRGLQVHVKQLNRFDDLTLINVLGVSLPFHPAEKQALLEASAIKDRESLLVNLLRLGTAPDPADGSDVPNRTIN